MDMEAVTKNTMRDTTRSINILRVMASDGKENIITKIFVRRHEIEGRRSASNEP